MTRGSSCFGGFVVGLGVLVAGFVGCSSDGGSDAVDGTGGGPGVPGASGSGGNSSQDPTQGTGGGGSTATSDPGIGQIGTPVSCTITAETNLSSAISTVGIVTWSTDLANIDSARIEFGLVETGPTTVAPVDLREPNYRTLLLGMKGDRDYVYRIVANAGTESCVSADYALSTGPVPNDVPSIDRSVVQDAARAKGFIITSGGVGNMGGGFGSSGGGSPMFIIDSDGDVVWWAAAPASTSRAHMSWDGKYMWMMELNVENGGGEVRRVSMDGLQVEANVSGLSGGHHDFTVLPDGSVAVIVWLNGCSGIIERAPDGTIREVVSNVSSVYETDRDCHTNSIHYYPEDDSYTLSDRNVNLFVKITRQGQLVWQFGGSNPLGDYFPGTWSVNHGHHMLSNGSFLFFNNGNMGGSSNVYEYRLDEANWTATQGWQYQSGQSSSTLGDVQRLPNGNTLVTYSNQGVIHEVSASGSLVQSFTTSSLGYADFRESMYGEPLR